MNKMSVGVIILICGVSLTACAAGSSSQPAAQTTTQTNTSETPPLTATQKVGTTTKTGKVIQSGSKYLLQAGAQTIDIDSYSIDLSKYAGQQVTVSGEYSGDTLFITTVN